MWGTADPIIPAASADAVHHNIEGSRLLLLEGCGHAPHLERPLPFAHAIQEAFASGASVPSEDRILSADGKARKLPEGWLEKMTQHKQPKARSQASPKKQQ